MGKNIGFVREEQPGRFVIYDTNYQLTGIFSMNKKVVSGPFVVGEQCSITFDEGDHDVTYTFNSGGTMIGTSAGPIRPSTPNITQPQPPKPTPQPTYNTNTQPRSNYHSPTSSTPSSYVGHASYDPYYIDSTEEGYTFISLILSVLFVLGAYYTYDVSIMQNSDYYLVVNVALILGPMLLVSIVDPRRRCMNFLMSLLAAVNLTILLIINWK